MSSGIKIPGIHNFDVRMNQFSWHCWYMVRCEVIPYDQFKIIRKLAISPLQRNLFSMLTVEYLNQSHFLRILTNLSSNEFSVWGGSQIWSKRLIWKLKTWIGLEVHKFYLSSSWWETSLVNLVLLGQLSWSSFDQGHLFLIKLSLLV